MPAIVAPKPTCRHCGATMRRWRRCPRCGRWSLASFLGGVPGAKH